VISLTDDPLTTHQDAIAMTWGLAHARLLTIDGFGHTELANPSTSAINYEVSCFTTGALPPASTVCAQNATPFPRPVRRDLDGGRHQPGRRELAQVDLQRGPSVAVRGKADGAH
jgi:TAP-like protein